MNKRSYIPFDTFSMQVDVPVSQLVRDGDLAWSCGQCPLDQEGNVLFKNDLVAQAELVSSYIEELLQRGELHIHSIAKLVVYYLPRTREEHGRMISVLRQRFGDVPLIFPIALQHFYYDGMMIEIDVFTTPNPVRLASLGDSSDGLKLEIVRSGMLTWAQAEVTGFDGNQVSARQVIERLQTMLDRHGLTRVRLLSDNWCAAQDLNEVSDSLVPELLECGLLTNQSAVITTATAGTSLVGELMFSEGVVLSETSVMNEHSLARTYSRKAEPFLWIVGSCSDACRTLVEQTKLIMESIEETLCKNEMTFRDVTKLTTHYVGGASAEELHGNMIVRHSFYQKPGPASTGVPVRALSQKESQIAISVMAVR